MNAPQPLVTSTANANLEAALENVRAGAFVFPCKPDKTPQKGLKWRERSTRDEAIICAWWAECPDALPAIDTGKSGYLVYDLDRHGGPDGVAHFSRLLEQHGVPHVGGVPIGAVAVQTPSGGNHLITSQPDGETFGNHEGALKGHGVNVRGDGGYVIAPGATLPDGRSYEYVEGSPRLGDGPLPVAPAWLLDLIRKPRADAAPKASEAAHEAGVAAGNVLQFPSSLASLAPFNETDRDYIMTAIHAEAEALAALRTGDGRNAALNKAAHKLGGYVRLGFDVQIIESALMGAAERNGYIAQDGREAARKTLNSGLTKGMAAPRPLPSEAPPSDVRFSDYTPDWQTTQAQTAAYRAQQAQAGAPVAAPAHSSPVVQPPAQPVASGLGALTTVSALAGTRAKPRESYVRDVLVRRAVNLLYGDGATGKSLLGLHLGVAGALGAEWLGMPVERGPVLYLSAEDEIDEMHRRLERILARYPGRTLADLADLHIIDATAGEPTLAEPDAKGVLQPTQSFKELSAHVERLRPALLILDNAADVFGGDEIKKGQVRRFIAMLRKLAIDCNLTVLLLAHPSQNGMTSGRGTSGNVAWSNSARSRLYFKRVTADNGAEADTDLREMELMKANHAQIGRKWLVRYNDGAFDLETEVAAKTTDKQVDAAFLELLARMEQTSRNVSPNTGASFAPKLFSEMKLKDGRSYTKDQYRAAMERLLVSRKIEVDTIGPQSRQTKRLVIAGPSLISWGVQ